MLDSRGVEAGEKEVSAFVGWEVFGDAGPDEFAGGVGHLAAHDEALGSGLFHHALEQVIVQVCGGVCY